MVTSRKSLSQQLSSTLQIDESQLGSARPQSIAIAAFEGRAGHNDRAARQNRDDRIQPGRTIGVIQCNPRSHLLLILRRVEVVTVYER